MPMKPLAFAILAVLSTATLALVPGGVSHAKETKAEKAARKQAEQEMAYQALQRGEILPLARILAVSSRYAAGEVIKIELDHGRLVYRLRVLDDAGRVRRLEIDARNGHLLKLDDN